MTRTEAVAMAALEIADILKVPALMLLAVGIARVLAWCFS